MKYIKVFEEHSDYEDFVSGGTMDLPNVSHCIVENEVHFNPIPKPLLVVYNVEDANAPTQLYFYYSDENTTIDGASMFDKVEIDGTEVSIADLDAAQGTYDLSEGEHTVRYTLKDPTFIGIETDEQGETVTKLGATFMSCPNITAVEIPNSVTTIGMQSFKDCSVLTSLTIPNSVTSIGIDAFYDCSSLTSVNIPDSVTSIGDYAFYGYDSQLTTVTIGSGITSINSGAFQGGSRITTITLKAIIPPELVNNPFNVNVSGLKIYVPSESVNAYKTANGWSAYSSKILAIPTT